MPSVRLAHVLAVWSAIGAATASAQTSLVQTALTRVEGAVYLDDELIVSAAGPVVLRDSTAVRTAGGRAIVTLERGGFVALDEYTLVRVLADRVFNFNRIEVLSGTAVVISDTSAPLVSCRGDARLSSAGLFRFDVQRTGPDGTVTCRLRVYDGAATVPLVTVISALRSGQAMTLDPTCGDMIPITTFVPERMDDFDRWSHRHATVSPR